MSMFDIAVFEMCQDGPRDSENDQGFALGHPESNTTLIFDKNDKVNFCSAEKWNTTHVNTCVDINFVITLVLTQLRGDGGRGV